MLANLESCSGCKKMHFFEDGRKTCDVCAARSKQNRNKAKTQKVVVLCSKLGCKFKKSEENKYCGKHQLCLFEDETKEMNKKLCCNYIRGCRSQLEMEYELSRCSECLAIERERDHVRRGTVAKINEAKVAETPIRTSKYCTTCSRDLPFDKFVGERISETKTCIECREDNKMRDALRDRDHRNAVARKNDAKPQRKVAKQEWNENNYEKVAMKTMNYRQRQIEEDQEGFLKHNAEQAKKWRENNPEKASESNEYKKNSKEINFTNYHRSANYKNLEFAMSFEEYSSLVSKDCYYCGTLQSRGFNGVDRKDQTIGYVLDNCVSCCKTCNYMKGSTSDEVFIKRAEHILTFHCKIQGNLYPECFANHKSAACSEYRRRAIKKQLDFLLSIPDYDRLVKGDCYICGKCSNENHTNGIDRVDNDVGYLLDNVKPCCGECNYMKKDYDITGVFSHFMMIYENHKNDFEEEYENEFETVPENTIIVTNNLSNGGGVEKTNEGTDDSAVDAVEKNRIKQRLYRERMIKEHGIEFVREKQKEKMNKLRDNNKNIVKNENKQTDDERKENARLRKQKQRENMREKYGDEEYKKMRAKEIAENRKKKAV